MDLNSAIEKAVEGHTAADPNAGQTAPEPKATETNNEAQPQPTGQTEAKKEPEAVKAKAEWNGDVNALPSELQEHAKAVQRYVKQREAEAAEYRKKVSEWESKYKPEELSAFEQWKQNQARQPQTVQDDFAQKWEESLLDTTGTKAKQLFQEMVEAKIAQVEQKYAATFGQMQQKQQLAEAESAIQGFIDAHPDFNELHKSGVMRSAYEAAILSGKPPVEAISQAYEKAKKAHEYFEQKALQSSQNRVQEKKNGVSIDRTPAKEADVVWVADAEEQLNAQIEAAMNGKKIKAKIRK